MSKRASNSIKCKYLMPGVVDKKPLMLYGLMCKL